MSFFVDLSSEEGSNHCRMNVYTWVTKFFCNATSIHCTMKKQKNDSKGWFALKL
jgi:hypothetical protein